ncbi:hypothetical protein CV102_10210 [Natronococcus pandeyae]|uniref:Uncharacterized protein n=1 Tax=Natronococcus pandeyae TaxID=2055836 RepID=A0A8J8TSS1_9EURY|nr:FxLYD domain-containing protein [Natronococcus pandeyae]TYL38872.1 hypothetical protein CV102_10210 [Natronococcus pandeyae]
MIRRDFLVGAAALIGMAGISSRMTPVMAAQESTDGEDDSDEAILDITDHELVVDDEASVTYLAVTVENVGDVASGWITLETDWYDSRGDYLDTDLAHLGMLSAGKTWQARVYYDGSDATSVTDFTVDGRVDPDPLTVPGGLEVIESDVEIDGDDVVVTGRFGNDTGETQPNVDVIALLFDDEGVVLGDGWVNETDVPNGETRSFECVWDGRDRADDVADHTAIVTSSAF